MFYTIMMHQLREKYPDLDEILSMHQPVDASAVAHTLGLSKELSTDLQLLFDVADSFDVSIHDWKDLRDFLKYIISEDRQISTNLFVKDHLQELLLRASEAQMYNIPLIPGYDGERLVIRIEYNYMKNSVSSGVEFEQYCASLLKQNGFYNIETTPGSGDRGVDITAEKDFTTYAFQCKYYSSPVGNSAVQEVFSGKSIYKKQIGVVMTNSTFTKQAIEDAEKLGVVLWDGDTLKAMRGESQPIKNAEKKETYESTEQMKSDANHLYTSQKEMYESILCGSKKYFSGAEASAIYNEIDKVSSYKIARYIQIASKKNIEHIMKAVKGALSPIIPDHVSETTDDQNEDFLVCRYHCNVKDDDSAVVKFKVLYSLKDIYYESHRVNIKKVSKIAINRTIKNTAADDSLEQLKNISRESISLLRNNVKI